MLNFDPIYLIYVLVAASAGLFAEGFYLLCFTGASYRNNVNRRLKLQKDQPDRERILIQLRRERGLTSSGGYSLKSVNFNQLVLQSGLTVGIGRLVAFVAIGTVLVFVAIVVVRGSVLQALMIALLCGLVLPILVLRFLRKRRQKAFGAQFPDALDMIVRSLRAGHPVPIAISMVAREMRDPIGSEFGIIADEITYGADLESGLRNLYFRVGQDDLPLFVTAVAIQGTTGGNLGEILQNLSTVIRERFKMRRKIRALASEARASALILSSLPICIFAMVQIVTPEFYASVWDVPLTKQALAIAGAWMMVGNFIMYRLVNFRI
ncbi:MAG TPA: type II secretion system F family protein [Xanthobacteraceae bacterium]|jgi:tight adherence protein B|nr:type II secretion system F family protein [Xanthobacteraceae bacterium]